MEDVIKKLKFKGNGVIINTPVDLKDAFTSLGYTTAFDKKMKSASTLVFINNKKELLDFLSTQLDNIEPDNVLWFAYPKGTSKIKTDINRDTIRETGEGFNITTVTAVSINDIWSALRFRPIERVGK